MKYLTIILDNTEGKLAKVSQLLADHGINIEEFDAEEIGHQGIMHLAVRDESLEQTYEVLRSAEYHVMPQSVLLVKVADEPGALAKLAVMLDEAQVSVRSMRIVKRGEGDSLCAIVPESFEKAKEVLAGKIVC